MARYEFYEVRSARSAEGESTAVDGETLFRRSFACAEREDLTLFLWASAAGRVDAFQLLFREHFVSWSRDGGLDAGVTSRHDTHPLAGSRQQGVRTLHGAGHERTADILTTARQVLLDAELPEFAEAAVRTALGAE